MSAPDQNVYRVHLADPGGRISVLDVPTEHFDSMDRGISLGTTTIVPWHRVIRYTREVVQAVDDAFFSRAEIRAWLDDGSDEGERIVVRADRFDAGAWTADFLVERTLDIEGGVVHLTKIHVPWHRVLEYERLPVRVETPSRPD
jgi:alkylated DNA nucleotide flippase Atl1